MDIELYQLYAYTLLFFFSSGIVLFVANIYSAFTNQTSERFYLITYFFIKPALIMIPSGVILKFMPNIAYQIILIFWLIWFIISIAHIFYVITIKNLNKIKLHTKLAEKWLIIPCSYSSIPIMLLLVIIGSL